jgi:hypothetical protein
MISWKNCRETSSVTDRSLMNGIFWQPLIVLHSKLNYCHSEYLSFRIASINTTSHTPRGVEINCQRRPYLRVFLKAIITMISWKNCRETSSATGQSLMNGIFW